MGYITVNITNIDLPATIELVPEAGILYNVETLGMHTMEDIPEGQYNIIILDANGCSWVSDLVCVVDTTTTTTTTTTVPYNGALIIAGTEYNNVLRIYTLDKTSWTKQDIGYATEFASAIHYANGVWLLGGYLPDAAYEDQDTMMYSTDGINWAGMGIGTTLNFQVNDITYGNGVWVAGGDNGVSTKIIYSTVAQPTSWSDWQFASFTGFSGTYGCYGVAYNNGTFLAFGDPGTHSIARSTDGINWTGVTGSTTVFDYFGTGAVNNGSGRWCASGTDNNALAYSDDDGVSWTACGGGIFSTSTGKGAYDITYGNGTWVAVGEGTNSMAYSSDGINWTGIGTTYLSKGYAVAFLDGYFYAGGISSGVTSLSTLYKSSDGITWSAVLNSSPYPTILSIGKYV